MMEIQLTNKLEQWDTLKYAGRALTEACSAWDLLVEVFGTAGYSESDVKAMCDSLISVRHPVSGAETEMTVEAFFKGVTIPYPYLEESTFRDAVTKFCQLGMLWCYCDDNDNIKFVSARPKLLQGERERAYKYPKSRVYGTTSTEIFLKNKVKQLSMGVDMIQFSEGSGRKISFEIYAPDGNLRAPITLDQFTSNEGENIFAVKETIASEQGDAFYNYYEFSVAPEDFTLLGNAGVGSNLNYYGREKENDDLVTETFNKKFVVFDPTGGGGILPDETLQLIGWSFSSDSYATYFIPNGTSNEFYAKAKDYILKQCADGVDKVICGLKYYSGEIHFSLAIQKWRSMYSWTDVTESISFTLSYNVLSPKSKSVTYKRSELQP